MKTYRIIVLAGQDIVYVGNEITGIDTARHALVEQLIATAGDGVDVDYTQLTDLIAKADVAGEKQPVKFGMYDHAIVPVAEQEPEVYLCLDCEATGAIEFNSYDENDEVIDTWEEDCPDCRGKGWIEKEVA